jgi:predicted permease
MTTVLQDLRFALRVLAKSPGFTAAAVLVLALGIGLNTATFSTIYALAFNPRPIAAPHELVQLYTQDTERPNDFRAFSYPAYRELRERRDLFDGVLAQTLELVAVGEGRDARRALAAVVSTNFFEVLGVSPARGRGFTAEEETPGADLPVVVVSHHTWRNSGRADLLGSALRINGRVYSVVGVMPEGFTGISAMLGPDFYFPLGVFDSLRSEANTGKRRSLAQADVFSLILVARLRSGVSAAAAASAMAGVSASLGRERAVDYKDKSIILGPLPRFVDVAPPAGGGVIGLMAVILLGLTGAVLLIVSLNLAGLLLVRGYARRKEFAIRLALGGTRARLVRQLLTEGLVLSLVGGALGGVCSIWVMDLVVAGISSRLPLEILVTARMPGAVVGATLFFCLLATLFFALGPALSLSRRDFMPDLQQNAGEDVIARRRRWFPRHPLVVAQIALSLALMIGAGLFARLASRAVAEDTGIDADNVLVVEFDASLTGHDRARSLEIFRKVDERLAGLPGVRAVSIAASAPFSLSGDDRSVRRSGTLLGPDSRPSTAAEGLAFSTPFNAVGADYFAALGQPLLRGRTFTRFETDHVGAPPVAIIDEALAALLWPGEDALGRRIDWAASGSAEGADPSSGGSMEIVGVARATNLDLWETKSPGAIYVPFARGFTGNVFFFVRSASAGEAALSRLREPVRGALRIAAPDVVFTKVRTFFEHKESWLELWALHRLSVIASGFGAVAALIAVIGLYGAKAYGVSRRTREIGIRLALGAEPRRLRSLILREGLASGLSGIALGLLLGAALGYLLERVLVDFNGFDPLVFGGAALTLFAGAFAASWLPARRATRVSPMTALRTE